MTERTMLDVAEEFVPGLKPTHREHWYTGLCPIHSEQTPSFWVNVRDETFHCFGCGAKGDKEKLIERAVHG